MKHKYPLLSLVAILCHFVLNAYPTTDADSTIAGCVNVINGDYCETSTDLQVSGPDTLSLQRTYDSTCGWRTNSQLFLVLGKDKNAANVKQDLALVNEQDGSLLTFRGTTEGKNFLHDEMRINHKNYAMQYQGETCELLLGDGTLRVYEKVANLPFQFLGEELNPVLAQKVNAPAYYHLTHETLPSRNQIAYSYDSDGHLNSIKLKNSTDAKVLSSIHFNYETDDKGCQIHALTSDQKTLDYELTPFEHSNGTTYALTKIKGSHIKPIEFDYQVKDNLCLLVKKHSHDKAIEIEYDKFGKVKALNEPKAGENYLFTYAEGCTEVLDPQGTKSRFEFDPKSQLTSIVKIDKLGHPYHVEQKAWGTTPEEAGLLLAKRIIDKEGFIKSYHSFKYDSSGNIIEEKIYQPQEQLVFEELLDHEAQIKTYTYSNDHLNLLLSEQDQQGNQIVYDYEPGTNRLLKELIYEQGELKKKISYGSQELSEGEKILLNLASPAPQSDLSNLLGYLHKDIGTYKKSLPKLELRRRRPFRFYASFSLFEMRYP